MTDNLEDKYGRFSRSFNIDIKTIEEAALGGEGADLTNYYTKTQADVITSALDGRIDTLESAGGVDLSNYYTKTQADVITNALDTRIDVLEEAEVDLSNYYTKSQIDTSLSGKSDTAHTHDGRYYTETEIDALLGGYATDTELTDGLATKAASGHNHDSAYNKKLVIRDAYVKSGNVTLPATASGGTVWEVLSGFATLSIPAAIGDRVELGAHGMRSATASAAMDIAVVSGGSIIRYLGSGTSTPLSEGDPGWYPQNNFSRLTAPIGFTVESNHLDGSNIVFAVVQKNTGGGTLYASTDYPFYWQAKNYGAVS